LGDAFGSLLCGCRQELGSATAKIVAEGAGVIIYASRRTNRTKGRCCGFQIQIFIKLIDLVM
jgi:GTP cyclohydrolase II